jgi:excisionase family DNA binding protein
MSLEKLAVTVKEAAALISVSERSCWTEIAAGRLRSFKLGRRRLVAVTELAAFVDRQDRPVKLVKGPGTTTPMQQPVAAPRAAPAPRRAPAADDGIRLPFIELPDGSLTTRSALRAVERDRKRPKKSERSGR